jgi:hypothetical protein
MSNDIVSMSYQRDSNQPEISKTSNGNSNNVSIGSYCSKNNGTTDSQCNSISPYECDDQPSYILLVEKETVFRCLQRSNYSKRHNCVVVTGKGYGGVSVRQFLLKLHEAFPQGKLIASTYLICLFVLHFLLFENSLV